MRPIFLNSIWNCAFLLFGAALNAFASPLSGGDQQSFVILRRDSTPNLNPLDYAPDTSQDQFPPYPPFKNADGSNITIENLRGVRLFGWKGCSGPDKDKISEAFDDFEKLAKQEALWKDIDWDSPAAKEILGRGIDKKAITNERKTQIQQIFKAAEQVRDKAWWQPPYDDIIPPWIGWRYLWIEIACSSVKGDPDNVCKDRPEKDPSCPGGRDPPPGGMKSDMEAFSNPLGKYSKITFCEHFFLRMESLTSVIKDGKTTPDPEAKNDLWSYQNRARTVFHEITHLNYFMNAPDKSPLVDDVQIPFGPVGRRYYLPGYGPERVKIIANYEAVDKGGFFTQRNADSFAWFAMSKYIEQEIGLYPSDPVVLQKPAAVPRNGDKKLFSTSIEIEEGNNADINSLGPATIGENVSSDKHRTPSCPDHQGLVSNSLGVASVNPSRLLITCDQSQISGLPSNVFKGGAANVYDRFCFGLDSTINQEWKVNIHGQQKLQKSKMKRRHEPLNSSRHDFSVTETLRKRSLRPNLIPYDGYSFVLGWEPDNHTLGCGQNVESCRVVFTAMAQSSCGQQGGGKNIMARVGKTLVHGCGIYSYEINAPIVNPPTTTAEQPIPIPTPSQTPTGPDMSLMECKACATEMGASNCKAADNICLLGECKADGNCQKCGVDCSSFVAR